MEIGRCQSPKQLEDAMEVVQQPPKEREECPWRLAMPISQATPQAMPYSGIGFPLQSIPLAGRYRAQKVSTTSRPSAYVRSRSVST